MMSTELGSSKFELLLLVLLFKDFYKKKWHVKNLDNMALILFKFTSSWWWFSCCCCCCCCCCDACVFEGIKVTTDLKEKQTKKEREKEERERVNIDSP